MNKLDITEKRLEDFADVFVDIVNVLVFNGKKTVNTEDLIDVLPKSIYKVSGDIHEQERDIAKRWESGKVTFSLFGLENQTNPDRNMPLRIISYDSANYRDQLRVRDEIRRSNSQQKNKLTPKGIPPIYPVITLVLYFGSQRWNYGTDIQDCFTVPIQPELESFIPKYKINVCEIAYLSDEQVEMFTSDFRIVADFFVQQRKLRERLIDEYTPSIQQMKHIEAVIDLLTTMTGDAKIAEAYTTAIARKENVNNMDGIINGIFEKAWSQGLEKGMNEGLAKGLAEGRSEGKVSGKAEGKIEGKIEGRIEGQELILKLWAKVNESGDIVDIQSLSDPKVLEELCRKYGIE